MTEFVPGELGPNGDSDDDPIYDSEDMDNLPSDLEEDGEDLETYAALVLMCKACHQVLTVRGQNVHLLADETKELYSTDAILPIIMCDGTSDRVISTCECIIQTLSCKICEHPLGYRVKEPCSECLTAENNGHFFMLSSPHIQVVHVRSFFEDPIQGIMMGSNGGDATNFLPVNQLLRAIAAHPDRVKYMLGDDAESAAADMLHKSFEERQLLMFEAVGQRRTKAIAAMNMLESWACSLTQVGEDTEKPLTEALMIGLLKDIAAAPKALDGGALSTRQNLIKCCRDIRKASALTWNRNIASAVGTTLKAVQSVSVEPGSQVDHSRREDAQSEEECEEWNELFWLNE